MNNNWGLKYKKNPRAFKNHSVDYTENYTEEMDCEGLKRLKWSMFDSPDKLGSGKMFMENDPVIILDNVFSDTMLTGYIELGYASKPYADKIALPSLSSHRVGKGVRFSCKNKERRMRLVSSLIQYGVNRIHLYPESIYFDTDNYIKKPELLFFAK